MLRWSQFKFEAKEELLLSGNLEELREIKIGG
jgi:hypothetical protein